VVARIAGANLTRANVIGISEMIAISKIRSGLAHNELGDATRLYDRDRYAGLCTLSHIDNLSCFFTICF
jgi:hypothetical protein